MMNKKRLKLDLVRFISDRLKIRPVSKKGQVTIFIILGILLLLALVLTIALKKEIVTFKPEEIIPTEKGKVENFITACMDQIGEEALFKIGLQSGYIEVPQEIANDANLNLRVSPMNVVPYWARGTQTHIPSPQEIKERIDKYMEENLRDCLFGMKAFQESYDLTEKSELTADTEIVASKVIFNVHWDIEIKNKAGDVITEVIDHVAESPVKLKKVYEMARRVVEKEMDSLKLEDITQDLIALEHPDVPVTGIELRCSRKTWDVNKVKQTLLDMLRINVRELKVEGTDFVEFPEELTYYQNHYVWDIGEDYTNSDISVTFNFDETYPYTFSVTPLSGTKMKSSQLGGSGALSLLCIQTWKFTYDLVYPVLVRVRDETTNYEFNVAFTVHLIRNQPDRDEALAQPSHSLLTFTGEDYCDNLEVPMTVKTYELVENGEGVSYKDDLGEVNVSFTCLRYRCEIGETEYDYANLGFAGFTANFPYCVGGIMRGTRGNYKEDWERVVTAPGKEVELNLVPLMKYPLSKISVVKHQLLDEVQGLVGPEESLGKEEMALIKFTFAKSNQTQNELEYEVSLVKSKELDQKVEKEETVELLAKADFTYNVEVMVLEEDKFVGGYKGKWTPPWNQLRNVPEMVFHVFSKKDPSEEEMFQMMLETEKNSLSVPFPELR